VQLVATVALEVCATISPGLGSKGGSVAEKAASRLSVRGNPVAPFNSYVY